jgi:hypothetical protein
MFGLLCIYFVFIRTTQHLSRNLNTKLSVCDNNSYINDTYNATVNDIKIQNFIKNLKMHTFDNYNETDTWDNGEVDWEL